ncbi:MAG TPA: hypothetical protein VGR81_06665 [Candidatus Acidoferrales bacterium]|nr:hypothetical protein [Candidatus Acidoferrales bacterium]
MFTRIAAVLIAALTVAAISLVAAGKETGKLILVGDLGPYGFPNKQRIGGVAAYTEVQFLSDNLLLVSVNDGSSAPIHPLKYDEPPSKLLLFDIKQQKVVRTALYAVEKSHSSVQATQDDQFVVLNRQGLHVCTPQLICGTPFATYGPVRVLPGGTRLLVGGNMRSETDLLDASTLQVLNHPAPSNLKVDIFKGGILFDGHEWINHDTVAEIGEGDVRQVPIQRVGGSVLYSIPVTAQYETTVVANRSGERFCAVEESYTRWNRIVNFLDIDSSRPYNFVRVRVFDTDSGQQLFEMHWDPRHSPTVLPPALSPDGHELALIRDAKVEVFEVK